MDFITRLPPYKNPSNNDFDSILVIIYYYSKIAKYIPYHKTINTPELITLL